VESHADATDILLVGGGVASVRCARTLRRHGFDGRIILLSAEQTPPYNRPPLSKELLRDALPDELAFAEPESWYARRKVDLRLGIPVVALDAETRAAMLADGTRIVFESCLLATGAEPRVPRIPGGERARLLRTIGDSRAIRAAAHADTRAVVIGGGFIGVEVASSLVTLGVSVTVVEMSDSLWGGTLGTTLSEWARDRLEGAGVTVLTGAPADAIEGVGVRVGADMLPGDLVIAGIGVVPRVELATAAGLDVNDGVLTDASHETSAQRIFAAGDVARVDGRRIEHWHSAREGGERAALAMLGQLPPLPRAPWFFSEIAGVQLDVLGFAPAWDETVVLGDGEMDRFAVAYLADDRVIQVAVVNGAYAVDGARAFVESRPPARQLPDLDRLRVPVAG
jgi:NADPH-dependent 2,4-dienoyl-CoA reductase/sulfur reductase-like enzyme